MSRMILIVVALLIGGWYILEGTYNTDDHSSYLTEHEKTIEIINNLEPTAAGGKN